MPPNPILRVLLSSLHPCPACMIYTDQYGAFSLTSYKDRTDQPDISTLAVWYPDVNTNLSNKNLISRLAGIRDRLEDASNGASSSNKSNNSKSGSLLAHSTTIGSFLHRAEAVFIELLSALHQHEEKTTCSRSKPQQQWSITVGNSSSLIPFYSSLLENLQSISVLPNMHVESLDDTLQSFTVTCTEGRRTHELSMELTSDFPINAPVLTVDLPIDFCPPWVNSNSSSTSTHSSYSSSLYGICREFQKVISTFQDLWNELDDIDQHAWVLEPTLPARRGSYERRIALRTGLSIVIVLDPIKARCPPTSIRFVGASTALLELRARCNQYLAGNFKKYDDDSLSSSSETWSEARSVRENLEICFGPLPSPATSDKSDYLVECSICYCHRLMVDENEDIDAAAANTGIFPDAACGNPKCGRNYHDSCLFEWLQSLPSARITFDRVFGTCPYCCDSISVKVKTL